MSSPNTNTLRLEVDKDGLALIILDDPLRPMNVVSPEWLEEMIATVERIASDDAIKGAMIISAKPAFMAGADLKYLMGRFDAEMSLQDAYVFSQRASRDLHRRMETCGKPFVAVLSGLALGGGFELALACHHRILVDNPKALVGLPEVTVGLLAGSGGTQRLPRMIGIQKALPLLLEGKTVGPAEALKLGMVDAVLPAQELLGAARAWLLGTPDAQRAWDKKGYRPAEGLGLLNSAQAAAYTMQVGRIAAKTWHNYPAPIAILDSVFEGMLMPFDKALNLESKYFARLLTDPVARNIIRTTFVSKGQADRLVRRPQAVPQSKVNRLGVLGAGMMGAGIAYVAAQAGLDVILLDTTQEQAEKGRDYSRKLLDKAVERGSRKPDQAAAILGRIRPTTDYSDLEGCELVIEAVFEDQAVKAAVIAKAEAMLGSGAVFASNTSTLPISGLAEASRRPAYFIGLHFFSPVDKMPLVEVIVGKQTSQETLARSLDLIAQLRMTPIVVNDSRGFYTSRVFQTFIHEGMRMLEEGVAPALIENAAKLAGMPVGPLALLDEVTVELPWKIVQQSIEALGDAYVRPCSYTVMQRMVEEFKRIGRRAGGGFYDYPAEGGRRLWAGLAEAFPLAPEQPEVGELRKRILYIQALETARCMEEGVLTHPADGDLGALLGWGFPSWTGGTLSLIDTVGVQAFVADCERLAKLHGSRFKPSAWLRDRALRGEPFYVQGAVA
ncbi:3-hydroxyacyl-CoA dehydrogenase NAD-binding domain-containing protein [Pseudomonas sp. NBRC 100443]|uniref:3-hydroxyacyl-CoA dehydrogenase NAD-binding domain-containing protein n=1 Tax=Pseudomonas sp. NBRC 100443 TaxID=1113665 RepID=UPI0024A4F444|nr:3-hydroxyacyl-CoA dehydrogenase NAD-binding domain-containing protein [Pseudomonas sp. NBRC 100443]GLU37329.1 fatty oxidation complex subunit alpha [Pseudomonas sp. NBRC 100443]